MVEASACQIEPFETMDATRRFARVRADGGRAARRRPPAAARPDRTALVRRAVGVAQKVMEMAVEYARERKQFDRPIGAYQAVSHRCAEMLREVEGARSARLVRRAGRRGRAGDALAAASMAKAYSSDAGWRVTASALQVHGGIGFTWEHDLHFFLKRAKTDGDAVRLGARAPRARGRAWRCASPPHGRGLGAKKTGPPEGGPVQRPLEGVGPLGSEGPTGRLGPIGIIRGPPARSLNPSAGAGW